MSTWEKMIINTKRGEFEIFSKGEGEPLCVTHHYSVFNESGDYFAETFTECNHVFLVNLREAGSSAKANEPYQLSMLETIFDLEAIREALGFEKWGFAGHSTGGMLGIVYGIYSSNSLSFNVIVGAAARDYFSLSKDCIYHREHPQFQRMQELIELLKRPDISMEERAELKVERTKLSLFEPNRHNEFFSLPIRKEMSAVRLNFFNREVQIYDVTRKLMFITTPTLISCGKHDVQCPVMYSIEMHENIPNAKLVIFEKSNHYPFLEEAELFIEEYKSFLKGE